MKPIYILNGPNLNRLGLREPQVYGSETLADVEARCAARAKALGFTIVFTQSNIEGDLVTFSTPQGELAARVEERAGPAVPASCGGDPEPTTHWVARLESAA